MPGWNRWYHCMSNTYGTWLPGDPRGFRTRGHREHVEGDYKNPPPEGKYRKRHEAARKRLRREPVIFTLEQRRVANEQLRESLERRGVELLAISVGGMHLHLLGRFPMNRRKPAFDERGLRTSAIDDPVRHIVGQAKQWSSKYLIRHGYVDSSPVWAQRGKIVPIESREHQVNTMNYIRDHLLEGAVVWTFRDGLSLPECFE